MDTELFRERAAALREEHAAAEAAAEVAECTFVPRITRKAASGSEVASWRALSVSDRTGEWNERAKERTAKVR